MNFTCIDIKECDTGDHNCDPYSEECHNTPGGHTCKCKQGYRQNGMICEGKYADVFMHYILCPVVIR